MRRLAIFLICAAITGLTLISFCNAIYRCGCAALWNGGDTHCNIHKPAGKHCPFCTHGGAAFGVTGAMIFGLQAYICFCVRRLTWWQRLCGALAAYPLAGGIGALVTGLLQGYWSA